MLAGPEGSLRLEFQHDGLRVVGSEFHPGRAHPKVRAYRNGLGAVTPPLVPILRGLVAQREMVLRELRHDAVAFGLVARIKAKVRTALFLRVEFLERRHTRLEKQVAREFKIFDRAIALRLVPCVNFLHVGKFNKCRSI